MARLFVGTAFTGDYQNGFNTPNMVAFDASGNVRWSVPGYTPQIATADGGVDRHQPERRIRRDVRPERECDTSACDSYETNSLEMAATASSVHICTDMSYLRAAPVPSACPA
jgi:hypothetical protein